MSFVPQTNVLGAVVALRTALRAGGVKFLRFTTVDSGGQIRAKMLDLGQDAEAILSGVAMVECTMALPVYGDCIPVGSGVSPAGVLMLEPDLATLQVLPWAPTQARVMGYFCQQDDRTVSPLCPRGALRGAVASAAELGFHVTVGVEIEFSLLREDSWQAGPVQGIDSSNWATSDPLDVNSDFISDLHEALGRQGVILEQVHTEAAPGQLEIVVRYDAALVTADRVVICRETIINTARKYKMKASFLPKFSNETCGSGMHFHIGISRTSDDQNAFSDGGGDLSPAARHWVAGLLRHLSAISAVTTPSRNSFRRITPGFWSGAYQCWAFENKESPLRVVTPNGRPRDVELKTVDALCNPYLALTAVIAAGVDGLRQSLELQPEVKPGDDMAKMPRLPGFDGALDALEADEVVRSAFGPRLSKLYLAVKRDEGAFFKDKDLAEEVAVYLRKGL